MRAGRPAIVGDPHAAGQRDRARRGDRRRPVAAAAATSACRATASSGRGAGARAASTRWRTRRCAAPTSCSTRPARWPRSRRCAIACRSARRRCATGWRWSICPGASRSCRVSPALVLDVAHNPQAAGALAVNLDQMGFYPRTFAVFGVMDDKDIADVIAPHAAARRPLVRHRPADRARGQGRRSGALRSRAGAAASPARVSTHGTPSDALRAALAAADPADRIVVFGSFYTVGGVLKDGLPQMAATHLG